MMQNVANTLRALEQVAELQPVGVADLARALELPKSSVQRSLVTLHATGWIRPAGGTPTRWVVTAKALHVGRHATDELGLRDAALPVMEELRRQTDETVHLAVREGAKVLLVERLQTTKAVRIILPLGQDLPMHASANGKAVLAADPDDAVRRYLDEGLPRYTDTTVTDREQLLAEVREIRACGYATNGGEWRTDVSAVASAVLGAEGLPVASVSVNVPTSRMTPEATAAFGELVRKAARTISARIS
ncbi:IclR family transcriptional regulator [Streptomyces sp. WG-D5]